MSLRNRGGSTLRRGIPIVPPTSGEPLTGIGSFRIGSSYASGSHYANMHDLVVNVGDVAAASQITPTLILKYTSGIQVERTDSERDITSGIHIADARANGWLLHKNGHELIYSGVSTSLADVGNTSYQQAWVTSTLAFLQANNLDGIFVDNHEIDILNFNAALDTVGGLFSYPADEAHCATQTAFADAQVSMAQNAYAQIKQAGYYVAVNGNAFISGNNLSNDGTLTKGWIDRWHSYVSALLVEYWQQVVDAGGTPVGMRNSLDAAPYPFWEGYQSLIPYCQNYGIGFIGLVYGADTDVSRCWYGRGSWLLEWDGQHGAFSWAPVADADNWNSAMATVTGLPLSAKVLLQAGCFKRAYQNGTIYVNSTVSPVTLEGHALPATSALWV